MDAQIRKFMQIAPIYEKILRQLEADPLAIPGVTLQKYSKHMEKVITNINSWLEKNIMELSNDQTLQVMGINAGLIQMQKQFKSKGLGKPKKCRKCGLYKI